MRALIAGSLLMAAAGLLAGCASTPPEEDPVQIKLNDIDARLTRIERIVSNQSLVTQQLDEVQASVRQLRGRIDQLENSSETIRKQQKDLYSDLDKRLGALQGGGSAGGGNFGGSAGGNGAPGSAQGPSGGQGSASAGGSSVEQAVYNQAFDALKAGSYSVAITGFKDFLTNYPGSPLAENAQYWIGESYYGKKQFNEAIAEFDKVTLLFPKGDKVAGARFKKAMALLDLGQTDAGRVELQAIIKLYPRSNEAVLARQQLDR